MSLEPDAVVVCSFGDASINHATAQAALNTTAHRAFQGLPLPPSSCARTTAWGSAFRRLPAGSSPPDARVEIRYEVGRRDDPAAMLGRRASSPAGFENERRPAVLHLRTVRYLSHAGADAEIAYRSPQAIREDYERDPILGTARWLVSSRACDAGEELAQTTWPRASACARCPRGAEHPQLTSAERGHGAARAAHAGAVAPRRRRDPTRAEPAR